MSSGKSKKYDRTLAYVGIGIFLLGILVAGGGALFSYFENQNNTSTNMTNMFYIALAIFLLGMFLIGFGFGLGLIGLIYSKKKKKEIQSDESTSQTNDSPSLGGIYTDPNSRNKAIKERDELEEKQSNSSENQDNKNNSGSSSSSSSSSSSNLLDDNNGLSSASKVLN